MPDVRGGDKGDGQDVRLLGQEVRPGGQNLDWLPLARDAAIQAIPGAGARDGGRGGRVGRGWQDRPRIIPGKIVAVTTKKGRHALAASLFDSGVWENLKTSVGAKSGQLIFSDAGDCVRTIPSHGQNGELEDILTAADSAATADFILETLRQFTENPDTEVILSIAGGRKTMSALGALAMSMLGRKNDRLCHVLVNPPFDDPRLRPRFFYPIPRLVHQLDGVECAAESAAVSMHDIPFPRFRELFSGDWGRLPGNFTSLVAAANDVDTGNTRIELAPSRCEFSFGGKTGKLPAAEFLLLWLLAERNINGGPPIQGQSELSRKLLEFHARQSSKTMPELLHWDSSPLESEDYVRKLASRLKASMLRARGGPLPKCLDPCPERGHYGLGLLSGNIHMEKME